MQLAKLILWMLVYIPLSMVTPQRNYTQQVPRNSYLKRRRERPKDAYNCNNCEYPLYYMKDAYDEDEDLYFFKNYHGGSVIWRADREADDYNLS